MHHRCVVPLRTGRDRVNVMPTIPEDGLRPTGWWWWVRLWYTVMGLTSHPTSWHRRWWTAYLTPTVVMPDRRPFAFDVESDDGGNSVVEDGDGMGHLEDEDSTSMGSDDNDLPMENQTHDEMSQGLVPFGVGESDLSDDDDDASADEDDDDEYDVSALYDGSFAPVLARPESRRAAAPPPTSDAMILETLVVAAIQRGIELVHGQATGDVYKNAQQLIKEYGYP